MTYPFEMGSRVMSFIKSFLKIGFSIQKLIAGGGGGYRYIKAYRQGGLINILSFYQNSHTRPLHFYLQRGSSEHSSISYSFSPPICSMYCYRLQIKMGLKLKKIIKIRKIS
jgi:hypothetical protein